MKIEIFGSVGEVEASAWDALNHGNSPFLLYGFLSSLESTGSIGGDSGWQPLYVTAYEDERLVGALAAFIKSHSYGEYIFDWQWANASERMGVPYYPKIVMAAPLTPATGKRILLAKDAPEETADALISVVLEIATDISASSVHWLFCTQSEQAMLRSSDFMPRASFQFHWENQKYESFDTFLNTMTSRKRKQIRRERREAIAGISKIETYRGQDIPNEALQAMDGFYRNTVHEHGGYDYLRPGFFEAARDALGEKMMIVAAYIGEEIAAAAQFWVGQNALYGRYWGCKCEVPFLHFELAYYQGIDFCIDNNIALFEAGAQGGHKLLRGFMPRPTFSSHWIRAPRLSSAIEEFLPQEKSEVQRRMKELATRSPYKN